MDTNICEICEHSTIPINNTLIWFNFWFYFTSSPGSRCDLLFHCCQIEILSGKDEDVGTLIFKEDALLFLHKVVLLMDQELCSLDFFLQGFNKSKPCLFSLSFFEIILLTLELTQQCTVATAFTKKNASGLYMNNSPSLWLEWLIKGLQPFQHPLLYLFMEWWFLWILWKFLQF